MRARRWRRFRSSSTTPTWRRRRGTCAGLRASRIGVGGGWRRLSGSDEIELTKPRTSAAMPYRPLEAEQRGQEASIVERTLTFELERDTKNTYRFQEVAKGAPPLIGTLYIQKWA